MGVIVIIYGTRPEAIKLGPVVASLKAQKIPHRILCTNQHTDLLRGTPAETDLRDSWSCGPEGLDLALHSIEPPLPAQSLIVVQGDTASALTGAQFAQRWGFPLAHVEAGLRSGDLDNPWPEEGYRREITQLATYHFAPTQTAYDNLISEGIAPENIYLTGNPIVSAIARYTDVEPVKIPDMKILFTMHRREWLMGGTRGVLDGLVESALCYPEIEIVWPIHPGVAKQIPAGWSRQVPANVRLVEPLAYRPAMRLLTRCLGVATDSGGLQEEAACLGVPCAVLRKVTDRPESVTVGVARLFDPSSEGTIAAFEALRERTILRHPTSLYGTSTSAEKIATTLGTLHVSPRNEMPENTGKHFSLPT